ARGVPCIAIAGEVMLPPQELQAMGFAGVASLLVEEGPDRSFGDPAGALAEVTERVLRREFPR
ncbi:MAG TPA: glycerate kinase, partial [Actinomycetota bacterium]|nr:glycerate kinase [Actinomycetota bacterium]